jgi:predicted TIM-barrel fold metal-dependent hydrolase
VPPSEPIVDSNVHLWDSARNPVFWLADRSLVRDLIGDYDSLPDVYTLRDYEQETRSLGVRGVVWSDAGASDPVAAAEWVAVQDDGRGLVTALVSLGDPAAEEFGGLLDRLADIPLVRSVRVRLASSLLPERADGGAEVPFLEQPMVQQHLRDLADRNLVATIEATSDQLADVNRLAAQIPELRIVVDHFGWPTDLSEKGRDRHSERLAQLAEHPNVATRLDAIGTIFGSWSADEVAPWLRSAVSLFGSERCMLGSDLPIERLRTTFDELYQAYDAIFSGWAPEDRRNLFGAAAGRWYGAG